PPRPSWGRYGRRCPAGRRPPGCNMLTLGLTGRIWVCTQAVDGRKSFDGLQAVVASHLAKDPLSGDLFVFRNMRGDRLRIMAWQGDGFALSLRRLERGTFASPTADTAEVSITATELAMILGGIELGSAQRRPRYERPAAGGPPRGSDPVVEPRRRVARTIGMAPIPALDTELAALPAEAAHLRRVNQELLAAVAELGARVAKQQAHIDRLLRMTFGC